MSQSVPQFLYHQVYSQLYCQIFLYSLCPPSLSLSSFSFFVLLPSFVPVQATSSLKCTIIFNVENTFVLCPIPITGSDLASNDNFITVNNSYLIIS